MEKEKPLPRDLGTAGNGATRANAVATKSAHGQRAIPQKTKISIMAVNRAEVAPRAGKEIKEEARKRKIKTRRGELEVHQIQIKKIGMLLRKVPFEVDLPQVQKIAPLASLF